MDRAIFAAVRAREIPTDAKGKQDPAAKELRDNIMAFVKDLVEEGRLYAERDNSAEEEEDDGIEDADKDEDKTAE